ncbi:hypothetical protein [Desulfoluna butyratoxydans]|uniref:Uncharacterized protein n=1 Tax=Desulfoluna butyratoxydans TaxID=231438 RepID=A0A4U8YMP0_9BACT|nr:hypothetical protein [Desulfoluna butyratoxydans]VFQ44814.1 hypothetical protein MSL71_24710 [Desulfoluna butyratoxydans]
MADMKKDTQKAKPMEENSIDSLVEAAQEQVMKTHQIKPAYEQGPRRTGLPLWALTVSAVVFIASFVLHYDQMFQPFHHPDARQVEHATRLEIISAADYLDSLRNQGESLPPELPNAMDSKDFIEYGSEGNLYTLAITVNGKTLRYMEGEDKATFLKSALLD